MTEKVSQIRLVRCPRCEQLLAEYAGLTLYTCGGCGVTLQAKKRSDNEANCRSGNQLGDDDRKPNNSSNMKVIILKNPHVSDTSYGKVQLDSGTPDRGPDTSRCRGNSNDISISKTKLNCNSRNAVLRSGDEDNESTSSSSEAVVIPVDAFVPDGSSGKCMIESEFADPEEFMSDLGKDSTLMYISEENKCNSKGKVGEIVEEPELGHEDNEMIALSSPTVAISGNECIPDSICGKGGSETQSADCEELMSTYRKDPAYIITLKECNTKDAVVEAAEGSSEIRDRSFKSEIPMNDSKYACVGVYSNAVSSSDFTDTCKKKVVAENENRDEGSDSNQGKVCRPESLMPMCEVAPKDIKTTTMPQKLSEIGIQVKRVEKDKSLGGCSSDNMKSDDEIQEDKETTNASTVSEEDAVHRKADINILNVLSKSSTTRSSRAYYGSVSSHGDDWDDHAPHQHKQIHKRILHKSNRGRPKQDSFSELQSQARKFLSASSAAENYGSVASSSYRNQDEPYGPNGNEFQMQRIDEDSDVFHSVCSWVDSERDVPCVSTLRDPSNLRSLPSIHQNVHSSYGHENLSQSSSAYTESLEQNCVKLLRKVEELRDHLQRSYIHKGKSKERSHSRAFHVEKQRPSSSGHELERELVWPNNAKYLRDSPRTYGLGNGTHHQYRRSRQLSTEQALKFRYNMDFSRSHSFSQDLQYPTQLPSNSCCAKRQCRVCEAHRRFHSYDSSIGANSPLHFASSSSQYSHNLQPVRRMDKLQVKKKHQIVRRYCRPMVGGAPFVVCYQCSKLLQLPADFLLSKRRHHKLKCGACSKVLLFSLSDTGSLSSSSRAVDGYLQGDRVSYTDEYGPSIGKSCTTEGESALIVAPSPSHQSSAHDRASSSTAKKPVENRKRLGFKVSRKYFGRRSSISPLHQLMGYDSPRQLIEGSSSELSSTAESLPSKAVRVNGTQLPVIDIPPLPRPRFSRNSMASKEVNWQF